MSRALKNAVLAVLFCASAALAGGRPEDLFDAAAKDAFQAGQKEAVLALDGGRFTIRDGRLHDAFIADPRKALLTNAQVAELLALRLAPRLTSAIPPAIGGEIRPQPAVPKVDPQKLDFDGGKGRGSIAGGPGGNPAAKGAALSDPAVLQAQFLQSVRISGTPAEKRVLGEAVENILKTKLGRQLAREFVLEGASVRVQLGRVDGSTVSAKDGLKTVTGTQGFTSVNENPPMVTVTSDYLLADADWRRVSIAGTLSHELFGHAFEQLRAKKAGVDHEAAYHYRGDELGSRLIDWTVQTELLGRTLDDNPGEYLEDPEGYARGLWTYDPYYVISLSRAEMRNPSDTLKARRQVVADDRESTLNEIKDLENWWPIIAHFKAAHKIDPRRFTDAEAEVRDALNWQKRHLGKLDAVRDQLESQIKFWATPSGTKEKAGIIKAADDPYFVRFESRLRKRALDLGRLRAEARGARGPSSTPELVMPPLVIRVPAKGPPPPEPITLTELGAMYHKDRADNPKHWEKK